MQTIKHALEVILEVEGLSKYALAKELHVEPIQIDNWLTEKTKSMRRDITEKISLMYGIKIPELFINDRKGK